MSQNNQNNQNNQTQDEILKLNDRLKNYGETIKKLHGMNELNKSKYQEENNLLKEQLDKKEEENKNLIEKIKSLERKNEDIYKNVTQGNMSDFNEIKKQYDKEKLILNELIKTHKIGLDEKSEIIIKLQNELNNLREDYEELKNKYDCLMNINNAKYDIKSQEMQFFKISTENSKLRTKLINQDEKIEKLQETLDKLKKEISENEKLFKQSNELIKSELNFKNNSYKVLINDYQKLNQILMHCQEDLEKTNSFNILNEKENLASQKRLRELENEVIVLKSENLGLLTRLKGNENELETNRKKLRENESKISEYKLSKQVFEVTYIYLRMPLEGRIAFEKEGENYKVLIHNRTATRNYSFLDLEIVRDPNENNKIIIKFIKENKQEEYFSNDLNRLLEYYEEYKKKAIEVTDFSSSKNYEKTKSEKKRVIVEKQLQDIFDI